MVSQPPMAYEVIAAGDKEAIGPVLKGSEIRAKATAGVQMTRQRPFRVLRFCLRTRRWPELKGEAYGGITVTRAVIEAHKVFKPIRPEMTECARMQKAFQDNHARLKLERLT